MATPVCSGTHGSTILWQPLVLLLGQRDQEGQGPGNLGTRSSVTSKIQGEEPPLSVCFSSSSVILPDKELVLEYAEYPVMHCPDLCCHLYSETLELRSSRSEIV